MEEEVKMKHPIQPLEMVGSVLRFKENKIVSFLLDNGGYDMNDLARMDFSQEDRQQFAQLIGYSLSGFGELSYCTDEAYEAAEHMAEGLPELESRNKVLREKLNLVKKSLRDGIAELYSKHPDDLMEVE